jgi:bifunctional non-homologous end joining protein LigD
MVRSFAWTGSRQGSNAVFHAFDLLGSSAKALRARPLLERKRLLRTIIPEQPSVLMHAGHIGDQGREFYRLTCEKDR